MSRLLLAIVFVLAAVLAAGAQEVTVSAAISLKEVVEEVGRSFTQAHPGVQPRYNFGSSGELQQQIEAGAPVDLFISAAQKQMDELEKKGLILTETRRVFARNLLTVITPEDTRLELRTPEGLLDPRVQKIVVGNPKIVPAGQYAQESLVTLGLWERLQPKIVFAENVRQALDYVSRGEVDAGFVYVTDAITRVKQVKEAFRPPDSTYTPVMYPVAVVRDARQSALARAFLDLLVGPGGRQALVRHGFQLPGAAR